MSGGRPVYFQPNAPGVILRFPTVRIQINRFDSERKGRPMNATRSKWMKVILLLIGIILAAGSAGGSLTARNKAGTLGAITGATAGGIMGSVIGHPAAGAVIGSGLGLGAGTLIGDEWRRQDNENDRAEKQVPPQAAQSDKAKG